MSTLQQSMIWRWLSMGSSCFKTADVFPCVAAEELSSSERVSVHNHGVTQGSVTTKSPEQRKDALKKLGQ